MTETITAAITDYSPTVAVHDIKEQISTLEAQINTLRDTLTRERQSVRNLYSEIHSVIEDNEYTQEDTITFSELSDILANVFSNPLTFQKEYQAWVEFKVRVTVDYKASPDDAQSIADSIGLDISDDIVNYDGDAEVSEIYVEDTRVLSVEEQ
jgi:prophage DNA circulation protein